MGKAEVRGQLGREAEVGKGGTRSRKAGIQRWVGESRGVKKQGQKSRLLLPLLIQAQVEPQSCSCHTLQESAVSGAWLCTTQISPSLPCFPCLLSSQPAPKIYTDLMIWLVCLCRTIL